MNDYKLYQIDSSKIDIQDLTYYIKMSRDKFNHLYRGMEHSTSFYYLYNFFTIASCNSNVYVLYLEMLKCFKDFFSTHNISADSVWLQTWMNIHNQDEVLKSHSHDYPIHGYLSLSNQDTDTVFTDGYNGNELYRVSNRPFQLYIGPGHRHHHIIVNQSYTDERITLGFDIQLDDVITENFSFIPIVL